MMHSQFARGIVPALGWLRTQSGTRTPILTLPGLPCYVQPISLLRVPQVRLVLGDRSGLRHGSDRCGTDLAGDGDLAGHAEPVLDEVQDLLVGESGATPASVGLRLLVTGRAHSAHLRLLADLLDGRCRVIVGLVGLDQPRTGKGSVDIVHQANHQPVLAYVPASGSRVQLG